MYLYFSTSIFISIINFINCYGNYSNYKLYNVVPVERYQLKFLQSLDDQKYIKVIFWTKPFKLYNNVQILVSPEDFELFKERLMHFNLNGTLLSSDLEELFSRQKVQKYIRMKLELFSWTAYHDLEGIYQWMTDISHIFSNKATLRDIGRSAEGREILGIEIINKNAKTVIVEGGIHGNEWLTAEFVTYLIYQLLNAEKTTNKKLMQVTKKYRWILIPVVNPDGYAYSMKVDRLWRKNRRNLENNAFGVDLNKNFDYNFCIHGGSKNPSSEYYCGPKAFSEPETQSLSAFVKKNKQDLKYYFSIHAYGQKIVIPYSDRVKHIENFSEMENYGKQAILKIHKLYGLKYRIGTIYDIEGYRTSGDSISWMKKGHKVKYAISFHLRDNGTFGYALPSDQILPACREALIGLIELMTARHRHIGRELFSKASSMEHFLIIPMIILYLIEM